MKKLNKLNNYVVNSVEAYACSCSCSCACNILFGLGSQSEKAYTPATRQSN